MKKTNILPALILLLIAVPLITRLGVQWGGNQAKTWVNGAVENFRIYDFEDIKLLPTRNTAPGDPEDLVFYTSHPPLLVYVPAVTRTLFGPDELSIRYSFAMATLVSAAALFVLARRLFNQRVALWALAFYGLMPFSSYYGRVIGHEPQGMLILLLYAVVLVNWLRQPTRQRLAALIVLAILTTWTAWMAVFYIGFLSIVAMLIATNRQRITIIGIGIITAISIGIMLAFYYVQWGGAIDQLIGKAEYRASDVTFRQEGETFTWLEFALQIGGQTVYYATPGLVVMALIGIWYTRKQSNHFVWVILLGLFIGALSFQMAFRNASFVHAYYKVSFAPIISILAAVAFVYARRDPRVQRYMRPILDGALLFGFLLVGLMVIVLEHYEATLPWVDDVVNAVNTYATPEDIVVTNFGDPTDNQTLSFYTGRNMRWDTLFDAATGIANAEMRDVVYIYCDYLPLVERVRSQPDVNTADGLVISDQCWLFRIEPAA